VDSGIVRIVDCSFTANQAVGGAGGGDTHGNGSNGSGIGPDFFNGLAIALPILNATSLGGGAVTVDPLAAPYLNNSLATLTATPTPGWSFLQWLGDASGTNQTISVSVTRNKCLQAVFATQLTGSASMSLSPQADLYPYGTIVKLRALPPTGTYFALWSGGASGTNNPLSFAVTNPNQTVTCLFGALGTGQFALTVIEDGRGHAAISPLANAYNSGQNVTLTAMPDAGQDFLGWGGDASGTQNPLLVTMSQSRVIMANFTRRPQLSLGACLGGLFEDGFQLTLTGEFGAQYSIEASSNLLDWVSLGTVTNTYGTAQFTDGAATNWWQRFYRASEGP
jgi:hypothetical protein